MLAPLLLIGCGGGDDDDEGPVSFRPVANFAIAGGVAEIVAATPDGNTLIYTDADGRRIGFVDITNPAQPTQSAQNGTLDVAGEPTSVAITPGGQRALVVVQDPNELRVVNVAARTLETTIPLGGAPDSISISPDGRFAAIAIENERQDADAPFPQAPAGFLAVVTLQGQPGQWTVRNVDMTNLPGTVHPTDPEPEFIDINATNQAAVTLQENNAIAIVDLATASVVRSFTAGTVTHAADTQDNGTISFTDQIVDAPREPDAIAWTPGGNLITANEGDTDPEAGQFVGGRGFTVFSPMGQVLFDPGSSLEEAVASAGLYPDSRSDAKGTEPEGVEVARFGGSTFAFLALERANAVVVYRLENETQPQFVQVLPTGASPEGVLAIPRRNLLVTANEIEGSLSVFAP